MSALLLVPETAPVHVEEKPDELDAALCLLQDKVREGIWARNSQVEGCILGLMATFAR